FSLAGGGYIERRYVPCGDVISGVVSGSNDTGQHSPTGDMCWDGYNGYLSLGGHSGQLIYDPNNSSQPRHLARHHGSIIKLITGGTSNGAYNNSHWEIIPPDGTQYWFGLNELPGYQSGNQVTNSAWTMPVVGLATGDSCHNSAYASSYCANMAWRWN